MTRRGHAALLLVLIACGPAQQPAPEWTWELPPGFRPPPVPAGNPMTLAGVELGRHLFHDPRLSGDGTMACATCHQQARAFSDGRARAIGITGEVHPRGPPPLGNVGYMAVLTWANPLLTELEAQALIPLFSDSPVEMGLAGRERELLAMLRADPTYARLFGAAFPELEDPVSLATVTRALAQFQRTLVSGRSPWDVYRQGALDAVPAAAVRGAEAFASPELGCGSCHSGLVLSEAAAWAGTPPPERPFRNTGLHPDGDATGPARRNPGLVEFSTDPADRFRFRTPSLRNVAVTAPYMHDGRFPTLEAVLDHYAGGGHPHPARDERVTGFDLTAAERDDLIAFLEALTDSLFLTDPAHGNPWPEAASGR